MGVSIGSRWAEMGSALARLDNTPSERFDFVGRGVIGGTHVGYLEQFGHLVAGIELSISAGTVEESTLSAVVADRSRAMTLASMYQAVGRIGYAQDHWLVYAKGGFAIAAVSVSSGMASTGQLTTSSQGFAQGWTVGAGLEYALTDSIVLGTDYSYVSLEADDRRGVQRPGFANVRHTGIHADSHVVMTRLSYRFR